MHDDIEQLNNCERLYEMLRYRRPHRSKTEKQFLHRFVSTLGDVKHDAYGNRIKRIGDAPILYSCHSDSVHKLGGFQDVAIRGMNFKLRKGSASNCLGADNAAGAWIMTEMIRAEKPGLYIFHRGEECGGLGSTFIAKNTPGLVKDIQVAMAFDRRGTKSIITHQMGKRCCSAAFADSLSNELHLKHEKDNGGSFTDTAHYTDLIPECTNVSVGFSSEHTSNEELDVAYLIELREAMLKMDVNKLDIVRKAGEVEYKYAGNWWQGNTTHYSGTRWRKNKDSNTWDMWDDQRAMWLPEKEESQPWKKHRKKQKLLTHQPQKEEKVQMGFLPDGHELEEGDKPINWRESSMMLRLVKMNPMLTVTLMKDHGISLDDLAGFVHLHNGQVPYELFSSRTIY